MRNPASIAFGLIICLNFSFLATALGVEKQHLKEINDTYATLSLELLRSQVVDTLPLRITVKTPSLILKKRPVLFNGTLENLARMPTQFILGSLMRADFAVYDSFDQLVWGCYFNATVTAIAIPFTLEPLEKRHYSCRWNLKDNDGVAVKPGLYSVEAFFSTDNPKVMFSYKSERRVFRVQ